MKQNKKLKWLHNLVCLCSGMCIGHGSYIIIRDMHFMPGIAYMLLGFAGIVFEFTRPPMR